MELIQKIENFLINGDPYTLILLTVESENLVTERVGYLEAEKAVRSFGKLIKKKFSSGMILIPFEEDMFIAFAPFLLDRNYMMWIFDILQQEYYEFARAQYPEKEVSIAIGCVTGTKQSTLEELCQMAEKLIESIRKQGKYGYKIMENK